MNIKLHEVSDVGFASNRNDLRYVHVLDIISRQFLKMLSMIGREKLNRRSMKNKGSDLQSQLI